MDARYLAGEAAAHAQTWSVIARNVAAFNAGERSTTTRDWVTIDHRRVARFAPGELSAAIYDAMDPTPEFRARNVAVHRLSDCGAVVTTSSHGTSPQGFEAEWKIIQILTVDGDLINRCELFDEADLDTALARFDELSRPSQQLENAAIRVYERFNRHFADRDWDEMAEILADDIVTQDCRRVVNAGIRCGRDAAIAEARAIADVGTKKMMSTVVATRGERLALSRARAAGDDERRAAFHTEALTIIEIDADNRIGAYVAFDLDDVDAAFEELDARYLAGEAAAYSQTWSVIARNNAAFNRRELPSAVPDWVTIDHRRGASFEPGDLPAYIRSGWDIAPDSSVYMETVHRLNDLGSVVTQISTGTSQQGFEAEWRFVCLLTINGEFFSGCELFDEQDIDAALARFDELSRPAPSLENAASQIHMRFQACFAARDWDAIAELFADGTSTDDRRPLGGVGVRRGRDAVIADWRATADVGVQNIASTVIATRGERLALNRYCFSGHDEPPEAFRTEVLGVIEVDNDRRIAACVMFDLDDIEAAFAELDARYLAGEAATHSRTWSLIAGAYAALNRRELPATTPNWVNVDHRRVTAFASGDMTVFVRAAWDVTPAFSSYVEKVHRLSDLGAVATQVVHGTSPEGFDAEWRTLQILTIEGDLINRCEVFDETDLDAALARFDELSRPTPRLQNAASQTYERMWTYFAARDWAAMAETLASDVSRRRSSSSRECRRPTRS